MVEAGPDPQRLDLVQPMPADQAGDRGRGQCRSQRLDVVQLVTDGQAGADPQRLDLVQTLPADQAGARGQGCPMVRPVPAEQAGARRTGW
jgi:hypothetical protein